MLVGISSVTMGRMALKMVANDVGENVDGDE